jgi:hypothetical protein
MDYDERPDRITEETNRERIRNIVWDEIGLGTPLGKELGHILEVWSGDPECQRRDYADAFDHALSVARHNRDRAIVRAADDILIAVGFYRQRRAEEEVLIAGRDRAPVRGGVRYDADLTLEEWLDIEG